MVWCLLPVDKAFHFLCFHIHPWTLSTSAHVYAMESHEETTNTHTHSLLLFSVTLLPTTHNKTVTLFAFKRNLIKFALFISCDFYCFNAANECIFTTQPNWEHTVMLNVMNIAYHFDANCSYHKINGKYFPFEYACCPTFKFDVTLCFLFGYSVISMQL